tara:strand:+ start:3025 stop:4110 length:1086 start_codon:yes stop_codon:yes gene_type:complete
MNQTHKIQSIINDLGIDLKELTILTELASGSYLYNVKLSVMTGAKVICVGKDSSFGSFAKTNNELKKILSKKELENVSIFKNRCPNKLLSTVDIVCNSGFLRPINRQIIKKLKKTSVIALMWETWEYRKSDLDLNCCQENKIPVIGTNENYKKIKMFGYNIFIFFKLLFELNLEIYKNKLVIIGSGPSCEPIIKGLKKLNCTFFWVSNKLDKDVYCDYQNIEKILNLDYLDALVFVDHSYPKEIVGTKSIISFEDLKFKFPNLKIGHICGNIDFKDLQRSSLKYLPKKISPFGNMSYQAYHLGPQPVLELFAAGLKVGEIAVKERLKGSTIEESIKATVDNGIGQDFEGGFMNFNQDKIKA